MPAVEINLTTEQLAAAYSQLSERDRRSFLEAVLLQPANQKLAVEFLAEAQAILRRQFPPAKQRLLDKLLDANTERKLQPAEQQQLSELTTEYGHDLVEKARAQYLLGLSRRAKRTSR